ncbi:MAG: hypothetical protein IGS50_12410 [Synechococcales cyanobacterium C42_A2020_086]|nr:hypothetical protein [Synechococcales cyanobacterium C42_A2020_086]
MKAYQSFPEKSTPRTYPVRLGRVAALLPWSPARSRLADRWLFYLAAEFEIPSKKRDEDPAS